MSGRFSRRVDDDSENTALTQQQQERHEELHQFPFANESINPDDSNVVVDSSEQSYDRLHTRPARSLSSLSTAHLSSSYGQKTPARSFYHQSFQASLEPQYSSQGVREQTQELATWALSDPVSIKAGPTRGRQRHQLFELGTSPRGGSISLLSDTEQRSSTDSSRPEAILEVSEPVSPECEQSAPPQRPARSVLSDAVRTFVVDASGSGDIPGKKNGSGPSSCTGVSSVHSKDTDTRVASESEPLVSRSESPDALKKRHYGSIIDVESQGSYKESPGTARLPSVVLRYGTDFHAKVTNPDIWTGKYLWDNCILTPLYALPAVFLGLLLNLLDALSYGMILFPLGEKIFEHTGADGISMFYVSCIVSQLVYSGGGSVFKGGVGSEMIEVVPFFHKMAYMIMGSIGESNPRAVLATTITSYAMSSILTGLVFFCLGAFKLGNLVSFFPRSILTGCIGGVGVFLFITGLEVSARLSGNLEYTPETLHKLLRGDTVMLWLPPLILAVAVLVVRHFYKHPVVLPIYFVSILASFYFFVAVIPSLTLDTLRETGWIFHQPESGIPFWHFYTYYDFGVIDWAALAKTIPTMFALTFFGILHVPINVPALGVAVQEDNVHINRELIAHGLSNALSGFAGSIQNYLVYANSVLFIRNGGNNRIAGFMLAAATFGVLVTGPVIIGYIPVMIVGTLIYMLGIELVKEALWDTKGKIQWLEYLMILVIVLVMGMYDFVVGIVVGIFLACLNYVVQTSQKSAIRATYTGTVAESTVRRHPVQRRFLRQVGNQIYVVKLAGYLFFGTIVAVEKEIRHLIEEETFKQQPIRFLILDFFHVTGLDFSAAEAFTRMSRILSRRHVEMILSTINLAGEIGKSLTMVGLLDDMDNEESGVPEVFEDLNKALESCENKLLVAAFKERSNMLLARNQELSSLPGQRHESNPVAVPSAQGSRSSMSSKGPDDVTHASPRRGMLQRAITNTFHQQQQNLQQQEQSDHNQTIQTFSTLPILQPLLLSSNPHLFPTPQKWSSFAQPLPLILQTFQDLTNHNEDFWFRAVPFFSRCEYPAGTVLYSRGDAAAGFYLIQEGILRAEYEVDQGKYYESIVAGTTCGELPFFAETDRTGTVVAEKDCMAWLLTRKKWEELERKEDKVARELLRIGLKLTSERMSAITSYVLLTAG